MRHVEITIFDKPRKLRFDVNALCDVEPLIGGGLFEVLVDADRMTRLSTIRGLMWAGLKHEDPTLMVGKVGQMINQFLQNGGELTVLIKFINDALFASGLLQEPGKVKDSETKDQDPPTS